MLKASEVPVYDSSRPRLPILEDAVEVVRYRDLLWSLIQRDLTVRYKRSALGFVWTMLNPLLTMLVLAIVFSSFFRFAIERYSVYLLSALLMWNFFQQSTTQAMINLVWGGDLINKIYVPKAIFIVSAILVHLVNLLLALIPLTLLMLLTGQAFSLALLFLPVSIFLSVLFTLGVGLFLGALAVFFVDIIDIHRIGLMILMYLTPLFYPVAIVPDKYLIFIRLNPMYYFVEIFRQPIYEGNLPNIYFLSRAIFVAVSAFLIGWWFFTKKSDEFAYRV